MQVTHEGTCILPAAHTPSSPSMISILSLQNREAINFSMAADELGEPQAVKLYLPAGSSVEHMLVGLDMTLTINFEAWKWKFGLDEPLVIDNERDEMVIVEWQPGGQTILL